MMNLKLELLTDVTVILMKREKITAEQALERYPALTEEEKAAVLTAIGQGA